MVLRRRSILYLASQLTEKGNATFRVSVVPPILYWAASAQRLEFPSLPQSTLPRILLVKRYITFCSPHEQW